MSITGNNIIDADVVEIIDEHLDWDYLAGKNVLITGANGMLPSYLVYTLMRLNEKIKKKINVFALVRNRVDALNKFSSFVNQDTFELIECDVVSFRTYKKKFDIIIHAASQASPKYYGIDPVGTLKANTVGTMNLLDLACVHKTDRFLFISSGEVYGTLDSSACAISESYVGNVDITDVRSCYAESKRMGETMCVCYSKQYGMHVNMIRLGHTYGPGCKLNDGRVFADFVKNILDGDNIKIYSDGSAKRCFLYVTDMIRALFFVLLKGENGRAYNVASMHEISIKGLAELLCSLYAKKNLQIEFLENGNVNNYIKSRSTNILLNNKALADLGWKEKISLETGFMRMISSYLI